MSDKKRESTFQQENEGIDIGRIWGSLVDHRWMILGMTALFTVIGTLYVLFSTPIYRADALIQVEQNSGNSILSNLSEILPSNQPPSAAEIELIKSRMVLGKTVDDLNLDVVVEQKFFPIFGKGFARIVGKPKSELALSRFEVSENDINQYFEIKLLDDSQFSITKDGEDIAKGNVGQLLKNEHVTVLISDAKVDDGEVFEIKKISKLEAINEILDDLTVTDKGKDTGVLSLSLTGSDPSEIKKILNSISQNYLLQNVERKSEEAARSLTFLKEQLPEVRGALDDAETKLNKYRQQNDSVDLSLEAKAALESGVALDTQLNELTFKEAEISKLYTKEHPSYKALMEKRKTLEDEKGKLNKKISGLPKTQQEILRLTRDVNAGQEVYMQMLNKQQELSITKASTVGNVRIVDSAITQPKPVKPNKPVSILLFAMLGIILSAGYAILKTVLHKGVESAEQLEEIGINVYANIPLSEWQMKEDKKLVTRSKTTKSNMLLAIGNPADLAIEAIRSLRTSLHFAMMEAKNNVLMISGASPGIGKSFVSTNLAAIIAMSDKKVLVIDADMRKGYLHSILNSEHNNGLSETLSGVISHSTAIKKTQLANLDFIPRGMIPPNPSELLMNKSFSDLLNWASKNYDFVVVDTPPILAVTDAAVIGRHVGTTLLVARFGVNTIKEIEVGIRRFEQNGIDVRGVIINAIVKKASTSYAYGNYVYSYK
ncbi:tyrosine-protein kinase Wzc [Serratia fonticola]|uniref:tyrosine-protein kinase Wzc n=1 Tax=Serratia fonticola TaxID=47917 RepID=UPI002179C170|nr:tyrosine-protein kinase Wzc [Serratia fonticola]CAI0750878.1 Tyrosine-protein kinase wzc [Serratia fonticola]